MIYFVYFLILLTFIDFFAQLPIMSTFAISLGATTSFAGFIVGAYSFSNLFSNVFSGFFVDKLGSKKMLTFGLLATGGLLLSYSFLGSANHLLLIRFLHGITAGFLTPAAFTYVSLANKKSKSGKSMAFSGAAVGIAAIIGPAFSGIMSKYAGYGMVFRVIGIAMLLCGIITLIFLKQLYKEDGEEKEAGNKEISFSYWEMFKNPHLFSSYAGALALMYSQGILAYMLPVKIEQLGLGSHVSGALLSVFAIVAVLFFLLPTNKLYDRYKTEYLMSIGLIIKAIAMGLMSFTENLSALYLVLTLYGVGFALLFPSISSGIAKNTDKEKRGKAYGLFYGFFSLGAALGSYITAAFKLNPNEAFISSSFVLSVSGVFFIILFKRIYTMEKSRNQA
mgnify:CR=1 FL=1